MRAMILAAGLGSRLRPLTDHKPKPLVTVGGRPMISYALDLLEKHGFRECLINVHHFADQMKGFISAQKRSLRLSIQDESDLLLGSGGAVRKAHDWLFASEDHALLLNADAIASPNLTDLCESHARAFQSRGVLCTLSLMPHLLAGRKYNAFVMIDGLVTEHVTADIQRQGSFYHFPGYYVLSKMASQRLQGLEGDFSIVKELWKPLIGERKLGGWVYDGGYQDLGTPEDLFEAEALIRSGSLRY